MSQFVWTLVKWGTIVTIVVALVGFYLYETELDEQIRRHVQQKIADHYKQFDVRVHSAQLVEGEGIEIHGLTIRQRGSSDSANPLVNIDEIKVICRPTLQELLQGKLNVEKLLVLHPHLHVQRLPNKTWNLDKLLPLPKFGDGSPKIQIRHGSVTIAQQGQNQEKSITLRDANLKITSEDLSSQSTHRVQSSSHNATTVDRGQSAGTDSSQPGSFPSSAAMHSTKPASRRIHVKGTVTSNYSQTIELSGAGDPDGTWHVSGKVSGLEVSSDLLAALPIDHSRQFQHVAGLRGLAEIQYYVRSPGANTTPHFQVTTHLSHGSFTHPRLPFPLTDVVATVQFDNQGIRVERLTAVRGESTLALQCRRDGYSENSPAQIVAKIRNLQLNRELVRGLPESIRNQWDKYSPWGQVDADVQVQFDGVRWVPYLLAECKDASFRFHKFPLEMKHTQGRLEYKKNRIAVNLIAYHEDRPVQIQAEMQNPGPQATGWVEIHARQIPISNRVIAAIPEKARPAVEMLSPQGTIHCFWRSWRDDPRNVKPHSKMELTLDDCSIRHARFPYPLEEIRGNVEMQDGNWIFRNLQGKNDTGIVNCQGQMLPLPAGGNLLTLQFQGQNVPLDEELRRALKPEVQRAWNDLNPRGQINLATTMTYNSQTKQTGLDIQIEPITQTASIEPVSFPYRMEKLSGLITYRDGYAKLNKIRAIHGRTKIAFDGDCQCKAGENLVLSLENINVDRLRADRDLLVALPADLRKAITSLNPVGPINLRGALRFTKPAQSTGVVQTGWDLSLDMHQGSIHLGKLQLNDIYGEVRLRGAFDGLHFQSVGQLNVDSVTYEDVQFTQVRGPMWLDKGRVLLGYWADREMRPQQSQQQPERITAKLYAGDVIADGWVTLSDVPRYSFQASLSNADVARFAAESMSSQKKLTGKVFGNLELRGTARGTHTLKGSGKLELRDADILELPLVVSLLKVLRIRVPNATAFTRSDMKYRIEGEHIYFDKLDLLGDALSLYGKGEMNFDHEVKLVFHTTVGRNDLPIPVLQRVVGEVSQQILQIYVQGTLENPQISNQAFPGVKQGLEQLQADLQGKPQPPRTPGLSLDPRSWFGAQSSPANTQQPPQNLAQPPNPGEQRR